MPVTRVAEVEGGISRWRRLRGRSSSPLQAGAEPQNPPEDTSPTADSPESPTGVADSETTAELTASVGASALG